MADAISGDVIIKHFEPSDQEGVVGLILPIQCEEFGVDITIDDQPDLRAIPVFYQTGSGDFWVAKMDGNIIGTIGLKDIGSSQAALRKMFVAAPFRGRAFGVAALLLQRLLGAARERGIHEIFLGTTDKFLAAHRFYEKNGFVQIAKTALPPAFPLIAVDTRFYVARLLSQE